MRNLFHKIGKFIKENKITIILITAVWAVCIAVIVFAGGKLDSSDLADADEPETVSYTYFMELLENGDIDTVYYNRNEEWMTFTVYTDESREMTEEELEDYEYPVENTKRTYFPSGDDFRKNMLEHGVRLEVTGTSSWLSILASLSNIGFSVLILFVMYRMMRQISGKTSIDREEVLSDSNVKFSDVIGHDEILEDIKFITEMIKNNKRDNEIGAKLPKGVLLSGEPGTGKTLIAKAIAGEAGVPFIYMNASSFIELYVGVGAKRVRELFKLAKEKAPCVLFIDEIDAVGGQRDAYRGNSEADQTINALLQEMDGFNGREGVFIVAATNRADKLDKALVRTGRFDRQIEVNPPKDWRVRQKLFKYYLGKFKVADDVDTENLSRQTIGFVGSDVAAVCNEAGLIALMEGKKAVDSDSLEKAIDKVVFKGNRSKEKGIAKDREIVAYHEAGHAVMNLLLGLPIARASIASTTSGIGGVVFGEENDSHFLTKNDLVKQVMVAYAGRVSESIKFGDVTTGASNDITQATKMLVNYVEKFGFDETVGMVDLGVLKEKTLIEGDLVLKRVTKISDEIYNNAEKELYSNYNMVEILAKALLEKESLTGDEIEDLLRTAKGKEGEVDTIDE